MPGSSRLTQSAPGGLHPLFQPTSTGSPNRHDHTTAHIPNPPETTAATSTRPETAAATATRPIPVAFDEVIPEHDPSSIATYLDEESDDSEGPGGGIDGIGVDRDYGGTADEGEDNNDCFGGPEQSSESSSSSPKAFAKPAPLPLWL